MSRSRRGRFQSIKARIGIAAAVLLGGGALATVAVATSDLSSGTAAQSAGYEVNFGHQVSVQTALTTALNDWSWSQQRSMNTLANMAPMRSFETVRKGHTVFATQRGVVVLATKHFLLVKSVNGSLHLWLTNGATKVHNVAGSSTGMTALSGSSSAARTAVSTGTTTSTSQVSQVMAGTSTVSSMTNTAPKPTTVTVSVAGTGETITITITPSTATVMPTTTTAAQQTGTSMTGTTQPTFTMTNHVARGDLVLVAGVEKHGELWAQLVLFAPVAKTPVPTPSATATATVPAATPTATVPVGTPTATVPVATPSASQTQSGVHF